MPNSTVAARVDAATASWTVERRLDAVGTFIRGCYRYNDNVTLSDFLKDEEETRNTDRDLRVRTILDRYTRQFQWTAEQQIGILVGFLQEQVDNKEAPGFLEFMTLLTEVRLDQEDDDDLEAVHAAGVAAGAADVPCETAAPSELSPALDPAAAAETAPATAELQIEVGCIVSVKPPKCRKARLLMVATIENGTVDLASPGDATDIQYTQVDPDRCTVTQPAGGATAAAEAAPSEADAEAEAIPEELQDADGNDVPPAGRLSVATEVPSTQIGVEGSRLDQWDAWLAGAKPAGDVGEVLDTIVCELADHNLVVNATISETGVYIDAFLEDPEEQDVAIVDIDPPPAKLTDVLQVEVPGGVTYRVQIVELDTE